MDRRQKKTRDSIFVAFSSLLSSKSYNKITVQEIIDEANVGRSTFYTHFETKDDLLKELCTELFEHVFSTTKNQEPTHDFSCVPNEPISLFTHILYHIRDNKNLIAVLTCESNEIFIVYFKKYLDSLIVTHMLASIRLTYPHIPENFILNYITGSFITTIQWWIQGKMKEKPEEISRYFLDMLYKG